MIYFPHRYDLTGRKFGRWTVIERCHSDSAKQSGWLVVCECGNENIIRYGDLAYGKSKSCGCAAREKLQKRVKKHGMCKHPLYDTWNSMIQRCTNPKAMYYEYYGGRGISVCDEWLNSIEAFLEYVGPKPSATHSLDRWPNNDGDYEPGNVRWATPKEQRANQRKHKPSRKCRHGHFYTTDNTILTPRGRNCAICDAANKTRKNEKKRKNRALSKSDLVLT